MLGANGLQAIKVEAVDDPLEANIVIFGSEPNPLILISCDLLYIGETLRQMVEFDLRDLVRSDNIFMAASHTHRATMTDSSKPALGQAEKPQIDFIARRICRAVRRIYSDRELMVSAEVGYGSQKAGINRRRKRLFVIGRFGLKMNMVGMGPNPGGPVDGTVRRIRFQDSAGETIAEVWSTALHPTGYPERDKVSADFPGKVRRAVREEHGAEIAVIFLQGFSGNIRPRTPVTRPGLRRFLVGPKFAGFTHTEYALWVGKLVESVLSVGFVPLEGRGFAAVRIPVPRELFVYGEAGPVSGWIHGIRLGDLGIIGVPSEVVVEYSSSLAGNKGRDHGLKHLWGISCIDHVWGYAPTHSMLAEGGYEVDGFCKPFGVEYVSPNVELDLRSVLKETVMLLVAERRV